VSEYRTAVLNEIIGFVKPGVSFLLGHDHVRLLSELRPTYSEIEVGNCAMFDLYVESQVCAVFNLV